MKSRPEMIPLETVLNAVGELCDGCRARVRARFAQAMLDPEKARTWGLPGTLPSLLEIIGTACKESGVNPRALLSEGNQAQLVAVRRVIVERARQRGFSYPQIGRALGRHHTSVLHLAKTSMYLRRGRERREQRTEA
jgi:chromosomal replication initiation ATPase DnaA